MSITTRSQYQDALKRIINISKFSLPGSSTSNQWVNSITGSGDPVPGTLALSSTTSGAIPTDALTGYPSIPDFASGALGYLSKVEYVAGGGATSTNNLYRSALYDRIFHAGTYNNNAANQTLSSQPSFGYRLPLDNSGNPEYANLELFYEQVTTAGGTIDITVTYTNEAGVSGRTSNLVTTFTPQTSVLIQFPLAAGDKGIKSIDQVVSNNTQTGTFNVTILRRLWKTCYVNNRVIIIDTPFITNLIQVFQDSALLVLNQYTDTTFSVPFKMTLEIVSG